MSPDVVYKSLTFLGFPHYVVGDDGSVWSNHPRNHGWRKLADRPDSKNHLFVALSFQGKGKGYGIHHLVLWAFIGVCPEGMECCHGDGDPRNNKLTNLRWDTHAANMADRSKHGRSQRYGETNGSAKLINHEVRLIRKKHAAGATYQELMLEYGVSHDVIQDVCLGRTYAKVTTAQLA